MAKPTTPFVPTVQPTAAVNANTASTGVKASYVVPAGRLAKVTWISWSNVVGATQIMAAQIIRGGTTVTLQTQNPQFQIAPNLWLQAADTVQLNCTTLLAASTGDCTIAAEEYDAV